MLLRKTVEDGYPAAGCRGFQPDSINAGTFIATRPDPEMRCGAEGRAAGAAIPAHRNSLDEVGVPAYKNAVLDPQVAKSFVSL
jgi:hypothetical protein